MATYPTWNALSCLDIGRPADAAIGPKGTIDCAQDVFRQPLIELPDPRHVATNDFGAKVKVEVKVTVTVATALEEGVVLGRCPMPGQSVRRPHRRSDT